MRKRILSIVLLNSLLVLSIVFGQSTVHGKTVWPTKTVTIVVPTSPGGTVDRISRGMAPYLSKELGVPVIIENRPGGNSAVGTIAHLKSDPADGSFWLLSSSPMFEGNTLREVPYKIEDFDYIAVIHWDPLGIFVHKESKYKTLEQMLDAIKANPAKLKYSDVPASWGHVVMTIIEGEVLGSTTVRVPFRKGGAEPRTMLLGRHVDFMPAPYRGTMAAIGSDLKCLGITKRDPSEPEIPLIGEVARKYNPDVNFPEVIFTRHFDIKKPFRTEYPDRWKHMSEALRTVFGESDFQEWNKKSGFGLSWINPQDSENLVYENTKLVSKYADVFK
jgi:putative tricarboxylic transport membrane protein